MSLDSTVIDRCATLFDWAHCRGTKGAVKRHDIRGARRLRLDPGTLVVMDRGYVA